MTAQKVPDAVMVPRIAGADGPHPVEKALFAQGAERLAVSGPRPAPPSTTRRAGESLTDSEPASCGTAERDKTRRDVLRRREGHARPAARASARNATLPLQ